MKRSLLLILSTFTIAISFAQVKEPAQWKFAVEKINDKQLQLVSTVTIDKGWHIYSSDMADGGPQKTMVEIEPGKAFKASAKIIASGALTEKYDSNFNITLRYFSKKAVFKKIIDVKDSAAFTVKGNVYYMLCTDEMCLPPADKSFTLSVPAVSPKILSTVTENKLDSTITLSSTAAKAIIVSASKTFSNAAKPINVSASKVTPQSKSLNEHSLLYIFIAGFLGGLAALLTPCIFPMIPMTVSFFTKRSKTRAQGVRNAFTYAISIIAIYVLMGFGVSKIFGIDALNALSTDVWFNLIFFIVLLVFAASFFGAFEITLPSALINKADKQAGKGGLTGIFFMAFTLALVSFSCTGPIIGTLLFESAATGSVGGPLWGMIGFSSALALPFGLFAAFPGWLNSLPKSGGWLNSVKVSLGFLELALALKFLSNADLVVQANLLTREVFLVLWIIIFTLWGFYLLGKIKFPHDALVPHISFPRLSMVIIIFSFSLYLVPGLWGAPLKLISGFAPPDFYSEWKHTALPAPSAKIAEINTNSKHCPNGLNCFHDYNEGLAYAKKVNKPVLLDFTGWACVNCRKMENLVWTDPLIDAKLRNDVVLISLYVDDKRSLPEAEITTKTLGGQTYNLKTIGNKWSYLQASKYKINSQPYYVLIDTDENTLAISHGYSPDVNVYNSFLEAGINNFSKRLQ